MVVVEKFVKNGKWLKPSNAKFLTLIFKAENTRTYMSMLLFH